MKILYVSHTDQSFPTITGGAIRFTNIFSHWQNDLGNQVSILDNRRIYQGNFYARLISKSHSIRYLTFYYPSFLPRTLRFIYHLITASVIASIVAIHQDLIYCDFTVLQLLPSAIASLVSKKKLVVNIQLMDTTCNNFSYRLMKYLLKLASLVFVCNPHYLDFITHPNIVETGHAIDPLFTKIPNTKKTYDLCFIGTVENNRKGIDEFIATAEILKKKSIIITQTNDFTYLNSLIKTPSLFKIVKNASPFEVKKYLNQSRIFLFPTKADSYGLVIGEALRCGTLVIASDIPEMRVWRELAILSSDYPTSVRRLLRKPHRVNFQHPLLKTTWLDVAKIENYYLRMLL